VQVLGADDHPVAKPNNVNVVNRTQRTGGQPEKITSSFLHPQTRGVTYVGITLLWSHYGTG